jgi:hypothetical protein
MGNTNPKQRRRDLPPIPLADRASEASASKDVRTDTRLPRDATSLNGLIVLQRQIRGFPRRVTGTNRLRARPAGERSALDEHLRQRLDARSHLEDHPHAVDGLFVPRRGDDVRRRDQGDHAGGRRLTEACTDLPVRVSAAPCGGQDRGDEPSVGILEILCVGEGQVLEQLCLLLDDRRGCGLRCQLRCCSAGQMEKIWSTASVAVRWGHVLLQSSAVRAGAVPPGQGPDRQEPGVTVPWCLEVRRVGAVGSLPASAPFRSRVYGWPSVHFEGEPVAMSKRSSEAWADEPATEIFTAAAILNREGYAPEAPDRSAQPQHRLGLDPGGEPDKPGAARRGAIAGGALLAGGAALGVAIFADSEPTGGETVPAGGDDGEGAYPGQGLLDPEVSAEAPPEPVVIDAAANTGSLDEVAPVVSPGAIAGVPTGTDPAHPEAGGSGAASASPDPGGHDSASGGSDGAGGGDDIAFGSGSGRDTSGGDTSGGDTGGGDEGGPLGVGSDDGVLDTGLLASDSESSGDESESSGNSGGDDDGGGGLLDTGLFG